MYLGPSLGWVKQQVKPERYVIVTGTTQLVAGDSVVLVNVAAVVTIGLPDVAAWVQQFATQPMTAFERAIWVKDLGGNAAAFNITITPFGVQTIDGLASVVMNQNRAITRLYPLIDLSGWFSG